MATDDVIYFAEQETAALASDTLCSISYGGDHWSINPMTDGRFVLTQYQIIDRQLIKQDYYRELAVARDELLSRLTAMMRDLVY